MKNKYAAAISILFHPLLMPSYLFLIIILFAPSLMHPLQIESLYEVLGIIFLVSFVIPSISLAALRFTNFITDLSLNNRRQRLTPIFFIGCFYSIAAYMFYTKISVNHLVFLVFATITVEIFLILAITFFWKISIHGAGIGGTIGIVIAIALGTPIDNIAYLLSGLVFVAGLVLNARLINNAHTPRQVYVGAILGFLCCFLSVYYLLN